MYLYTMLRKYCKQQPTHTFVCRLVALESKLGLKSVWWWWLGLALALRGLGLENQGVGLVLESFVGKNYSSPLNSTIENMYKELVAYLCLRCVLTGSAACTLGHFLDLTSRSNTADENASLSPSVHLVCYW